MEQSTVTVAITTIPGRADLLDRAIGSVSDQTREPDDIVVVRDRERRGVAYARNRALGMTHTDFIAWLDDDDVLLPNHIETLMNASPETDLVYPTPKLVGRDSVPLTVPGGGPPWGREFDKDLRHHLTWVANFIPITCLMRMSSLLDAGGFPIPGSPEWPFTNSEDWGAFRKLAKSGARFKHVNEVTWEWHFWDGHTGGRPLDELQ